MPKLLILVGIPYSGLEKYTRNHKNEFEVLSREHIRNDMYGKNCLITSYTEAGVDQRFKFRLQKAYFLNLNIILSNSNCKEEYIDQIRAECPANYDIEVKFFPVSLWKAYLLNYIRFLGGERYIPYKIMKLLKRSYDKINKTKYETPKNHESSNKLYRNHNDFLFFDEENNPN
jgi:hypothetical protein